MSVAIGPAGARADDPPERRWAAACAAAEAEAPYLAALLLKHPAMAAEGPDAARTAIEKAIQVCQAIAAEPGAFEADMARLRRAKASLHLAVALLDLSAEARLNDTTAVLTHFADAATQAALTMAAGAVAASGEMAAPEAGHPRGPAPGFIVLAMGKAGAFELNYSSDVDLSLFFAPGVMPVALGKEARVVAQRITRHLVRALDLTTAQGYVLRTDLRLRPDPNSTSPAVSVPAALNYYQSVGQNWERAAFIKARPCAGDIGAGLAFLRDLEPFVWRRHLDYAAIEDITAIKRRIRLTHGSAELSDPAVNVKLAPGGIRDIELFAQTQLLIRGGRNRALREPRTREALAALAQAGVLPAAYAQDLTAAYDVFRLIEHRIQMLEDEQTHTLPDSVAARDRIARLAGLPGAGALEDLVRAKRQEVSRIDAALFSGPAAAADPLAELRFGGLEDDPAVLETLRSLGFGAPGRVGEVVRRWLAGGPRALRTERARRLLRALLPAILRACAGADEPDGAFARFSDLIDGLSAGVAVLSLFDARPDFLGQIVTALAISPRLSAVLAQRPSLLDALAEADFHRPLEDDEPDRHQKRFAAAIGEFAGLEAAMNAARRVQREASFRIALHALKGQASPAVVGRAFADLAQASIAAMAQAALSDTLAARGPAPGRFAILGLGKLGAGALSVSSDLDLMVVYDAPAAALETGAAQGFYTHFTQRLIAALSAPTEEGLLYEVDMKLRPSGSKGPVAVRLSSFSRYYREEAWTWELLALTCARPVAGDEAFCAALADEIRAIIAAPRDGAKVMADTAAMRALMDQERPAKDKWDVKLRPGGLVDIEFMTQALQLSRPAPDARWPIASAQEAIALLMVRGALDGAQAKVLTQTLALCMAVQHAQRLSADGALATQTAPAGVKAFLASLARARDFPALEAALDAGCGQTRLIFLQLFAAPGDGTAQAGPLDPS